MIATIVLARYLMHCIREPVHDMSFHILFELTSINEYIHQAACYYVYTNDTCTVVQHVCGEAGVYMYLLSLYQLGSLQPHET